MAEMNLNTEEKNQILALTTDTVITHDVSEEFSLPDYVPEIRKLLHTKVGVLPESKYMGDEDGGTSLEFAGTVTYMLIYTNDEGEICSLPLTSSYEAKATLNGRPTTVFIDTVADGVSPRVNGPRKITLKTRLKSRLQGWQSREESEKIENKSTADELFIERDTEAIKTVGIKQVSLTGVKVSDQLDMQGLKNPKPLWCDATAVVNDVKAQNNSVSVKAEAKIKCVCLAEGELVTLTKDISMAEEIEAEGASLGDLARIDARCVSLAISNEQQNDIGQLFFDLSCEFEGEVIRNTENQLTRDCYSTKYETEQSYKELDTYIGARAQNCSFTVNEGVKRKNKEITKIIDVLCDPVYEKTEFKGGRATVSGKLLLTLIGSCQENDEISYVSENYEIPLKYTFDTGSLTEPTSRCDISLGDLSARIEGEKLYVNAEAYLAYEIMDKRRVKVLSSCVLKKDKEIKKDAGCVRVYFPKEGDTLWKIAKKYHTTKEVIKEQNNMVDEEIENRHSLII